MGCKAHQGWGRGRRLAPPRPDACLVFAFVVIKAASSDLTWDEDAQARANYPRGAWIGRAGTVLCVVLAVIWVGRLHFQRYADWPEDSRLQNRLAQALAAGRGCLSTDVWGRYGHEYYLDRWFRSGEPLTLPQCPPR